jgi:hypothetical protein
VNDFTVSLEPGAGPRGDLAAMLSLSDVLYEPQSVKVAPRAPLRATVAEPAHWLDRELEREVATPDEAGGILGLKGREKVNY